MLEPVERFFRAFGEEIGVARAAEGERFVGIKAEQQLRLEALTWLEHKVWRVGEA